MIQGAVTNMYEAHDTLCDHGAPLKLKIFVVEDFELFIAL